MIGAPGGKASISRALRGPSAKTEPIPTFNDGVDTVRCTACYAPLRNGAGELLVTVRASDLEAVTAFLDAVGDGAAWGPLVWRFERALGLSVRQLEQRRLRRADVGA